MITYIHKHSILLKDNKRLLVNCPTWAEETLTGDNLAQFYQDWTEHLNYLDEKISQNIVQQEEIFEEVSVAGQSFKISVGFKFIIIDPNNWADHAKFTFWQNEMQNDSNVIVYNAPELQTG